MKTFAIAFALCALLFVTARARADEMEDRRVLHAAAADAYAREDFDELDRVGGDLLARKARTSSGLWKFAIYSVGIGNAFPRCGSPPKSWDASEGRTARWAARSPDSSFAHVLHAKALIAHGWAVRGCGYANTVRAEAWPEFEAYIERARKHLESHKKVASVNPLWYSVMIDIAKIQSWDPGRFDRVFDEAVRREPDFYPAYFAAVEYLLPKWGGSVDEIEAFADAAVARTKAIEGKSMYARIYWFASQTQFKDALFDESKAAWPKMKAGFEDVIARYPDSWNLNNYARFACLARDRAKTTELLRDRRLVRIADVWQPTGLYVSCRNWIDDPSPDAQPKLPTGDRPGNARS